MRQVLMLEKSDIETMRSGHTITLTTASGVVELGILGAKLIRSPAAAPTENGVPDGRTMPRLGSPERAQLVAKLKHDIGPRPKINAKAREAYPVGYRRDLLALAHKHGASVVAEASGVHHTLIRTWAKREAQGVAMRKDKN